MASSSSRSVKVTDLNPHLLCVLCGGYYVDATTIIECLHSFCKSCIVRYLETNKYCPICDVQVHKSKPLLNIRSDRKLQAIVYKLVPDLFQRELNCRKEFYNKQCESKLGEDVAAAEDNSPVYSSDETLLLGVQYHEPLPHKGRNKRYFRCPVAITISHLQKLMRAKFDLNASQRVEFLHEGDLLPDHMSLMDLAYMYHWKRKHPIELEYRLMECQQKKIKLSHEEEKPVCVEEKQNIECGEKVEVVRNLSTDEPDREVQLRISENGVMSVQSVDCSSNTVVTSTSDCGNPASKTSVPVKDIQLETMQLIKSLGNDVTLNFDNTSAKDSVDNKTKSIREMPTNNNTIENDMIINIEHNVKNCAKHLKEDTIKNEVMNEQKDSCKKEEIVSKEVITKMVCKQDASKKEEIGKTEDLSKKEDNTKVESVGIKADTIQKDAVCRDMKERPTDTQESIKDFSFMNNNDFNKNKNHTNNSSLSIIAVPPINSSISTPGHAQKVYPGAVKDASHPSRSLKIKDIHVGIRKPEVTLKPIPDKQEAPKSTSTARYKTLKAPIKPWNPTIPRSTIMAMKQAQAASQEKEDYPGKTPKAPKFFKVRNVPRFLGNPASGVKPMYQVLPGSELTTQTPQTSATFTPKPVSTGELTVMKIDPKTLTPITVSQSRSSKLNSSSTKPSTTLAPNHKTPERDSLNCGTPIRNPVSKSSSMSSRAPNQVHPPNFPPNPFGLPSPHMLYPGFPRSFSQVDSSGNQLPGDNQILRAMSMLYSPGAAFHPSLPPAISMRLNPHHPQHRSPSEKLNFKYNPSDFHKATTTTTPSVQRIPPSGPSSKISSSASNNLSGTSESCASPSIVKEMDKLLAEERSNNAVEESRRSALFSPTDDVKPSSSTSSSNANRDLLQRRVGKISPLPITNGLPVGNLDRDLLKLNNQNLSAKRVPQSSEQSSTEENQKADSKNVSESNNCC